MSKSAKTVVITAAIISQVETVLADKKQHKYSVSKIYAAHNAVFGLNETPETCVSCLTKRAAALEKWYNSRENEATNEGRKLKTMTLADIYDKYGAGVGTTDEEELSFLNTAIEENTITDEAERALLIDRQTELNLKFASIAEPKTFDVTNKAGEAFGFMFDSKDGETGIVKLTDGSAVKAGTYTTAEGDTIAVQPGGKATFKPSIL